MGCEICKFRTGSKKVLPAYSARADSLTLDTGDLWIFRQTLAGYCQGIGERVPEILFVVSKSKVP